MSGKGEEAMKVLITGRLPDRILSHIESRHEVAANREDRPLERKAFLEQIHDRDGLLCMITDRIDQELLDHAPNLRMVANMAVGYDNIDLAAATARGVRVSNTPGVLTEATADLTFGLILATARRFVEGDKRTRSGEFKFFAPFLFLGSEVNGKTLGIVGMGKIGKALAKRARGFDMPVIYHSRHRIDSAEEQRLNARHVSLQGLLADADFVSLHVPLSLETRHLIGEAELKQMKPTAFLINASRGPVVDEHALVDALRNKAIAGAGLDVYEQEPALAPGLTELDNVVLLPHVGSATRETRTKMAALAAENLLTGLAGEIPPDCLNCG